MSNKIPWSEIRKSYGGDTETSESPNPFRRRKVEDYLQPETAETGDEFSLLDALSAGTGRFMEHVGTGIEEATRPDNMTPSEWKKYQSPALRTAIETLRDEGNAMFERNHRQYEDNSVPYHLQNIFESAPESAAIMAGSMIAGSRVGGLLGAAGNGLIKGAEMLPRGLSMVDKLYRAYNASNPASKVARTIMPQNARILASAEMGAGMEAYVEQLEAEKRYIENAKRNGTYVQDQTEAEAQTIGNRVFWDNMGIISAFNLPQYNMVFGKGAKSLLGKIGRFGAAAGSEGGEEVVQEIASAHELGEPIDWRNIRDAAVAGVGMGAGFHGVGRGIGYVGDRIAGRPSDEEIERLEQARSETYKKLSDLIAKTETDDSGNTRYADGSIYGDYRRDFSGGIQSGLNSARKALDGKQMDNGTVGCVEAVTKILAHVHPEFQKMVDDKVVNTVEGENSLHSRLEKMGVEIVPFDEANVAPGDIIFYDGAQTYQHVLVADHKDADGNWRVFGNSSSANKIMEQPLYQGQTPAWIAKVSNISGFNPQNSSPSQGNAYDPNFSERQNRMWQAAQRAAAYANEKYGMNLQPDWLYRQLAHEAGSNFDSNPELAANHNYGGLKGGKKAIGEDSRGHKYFANDDDFFEAYVDEFIGLRPELKEAKSLEDFARIMKETDYYRDSYENYVAGMKGVQVPNAGRSSGQSADATGMKSWDDYLKERTQPRQEEPPMQARQIDFKATDDETKSVFDGFAKDRITKAIDEDDADTALFFRDMFSGDEFQNTEENRAAIAERYGDDLAQFAQTFTPTLPQAEQPQTVQTPTPQQQKPTAKSTSNKYIRNNDVLQAGNNFLEELRAKGTQADMATTVRLQAAISSGDTAAVENILKANNRPVVAAQQTTQAQPQQQTQTDPVKQNRTPENIIQQGTPQQESTQQQQPTKPKKQPKTGEEKAQSALAKPLQGKKSSEARRKAGNAVIFLAGKNGIEISHADRKSLENGKTSVVNQWRDILIGKGILSPQTTQSPPKQSSPAQPQAQQQTQETAQPAEKPLTLQERAQQIVSAATEAARQNWEDIKQDYQQRGALARMPQSADINRALASRPSAGTFSRRMDARRDVQEMRDLDTIPAWRGRTREDNLTLRRQARDKFRQMREASATNMINSLPETEVLAQTGPRNIQNTEDTVNVNRSLAEIQAREQQARKAQEAQRQQEQEERARLDSYTRDDTQPEIGAERGTRNPETELYHVESPQEIAVREQQAREARRAQARQDIAYSDAESRVEIGAVRGERNPETESYRVETPQEINAREQRAREARQARARQDVAYSDTESHPEVGAVQGRETPETEPYHVETPQEISTREQRAREERRRRDNTYSDNESFQEVGAARGTRNPEVETPHVETPQEIRTREQQSREAEQEQQRRTNSYARDDAQEGDGAVQGRNDIEAEPYHVQTQEEITAERERGRTEQTQRNVSYSDDESHQEVGSKQGGNVSSKATTPKQQQKKPLTDEQLKDLLAKIKNAAYQSMEGDANTDIIEFVDDADLTPAQKLLKSFSEKLGVPLRFFRNPDGRFHGSFSNGVLFLNVNSKKGLGGVFWHESFHWLKANNPKLYAKLVDAAGITDKDRQAFLDRTGRKDLKTNEEIDEEVLADQMGDVAKRTGLLQTIAGKNRGVVERVVQWLKDTMNKFIETFRNPTGGLTTKQAKALAKEFGQIARQLKDENGNAIFRVNNRTGDIEVVEGRKARELSKEEIEAAAKSPNAKHSVDPNDNSSESLGQKIKNFASTVFNGKPQSKNHKQFIIDKLEELTRYKTYFNTNAKNEADVIVDSFQKIIRARHAYDFEKLLPATGEPIAKVLGLNPSADMSNYIADWMMTGAINNTSKEATAFQKAMRAHPAEAELLQSIRDTFQEMANMTAEEAVESNIVRDKKSKTFREWLGEKFSKEEWVDDLHPIQQAYDQMLAKAPPAVADIIKKNFDPYMSASLFRGKGAIADMMIGDKKEVTDEDVDIVRRVLQREFPNVNFSDFKPLAAIAKMVDYDVEGLERYALAKLDKEMHEKKNSGDAKYANLTPSYTEAQCDEIINAGKAKYDAAQRALVDYSNTLTAIQYSTGVISANQFYQRVNGWKNFVPTARVFEEYEDISVDKSDSSKHKTGSKRRVYAPLGKLEDNTNLFIRQALQNRARLEIVTMARLGNFGDIFAETPKGYPQGHTIHFKENGKMKYLVTPDESLKRAVESIQTPADANIVVQAFKTAGMVMRGAYTMWNFEFASGNPFRDLQDAFIHNKYGSRNPFVAIPAMVSAAVSGFAQSVGAKIKTEEFRTFLAEGGAQSGFSYEITEGASRRVNSFGKKSLAKSTWDKFLMIAEASENMTRFSTFKTAKDALAKQHGGIATPHDLKLAAMQARRATVDFARAGRTMRGVNKVALFSNAAMQSLALWGEKINAARKSKEGRKELFAAVFKTVMGGVMSALALAALNFSDDDRRKKFEQRPTWEKDTYWIFGDGLRVPKGMDLGIKLTSALTEEFAMWLASNKPVEWKRIINNIGRGLPSITTTIFTPAVESYMNYSIFKDAPIVPYGQQDDPKYKQYGKNTSWVAKQLGKTFNQSPRQIDHLIAGYGGSMFTALTGGSDGIPIVRRFMFDPDKNPRIVQDYYKALEEQEEMFAEYKARRADGEKVELPEDYDRGLHARLKKSREAMTRISKAEMRIMDDPKLDADKRKEKLRELEKRRVALCERVLGKAR